MNNAFDKKVVTGKTFDRRKIHTQTQTKQTHTQADRQTQTDRQTDRHTI